MACLLGWTVAEVKARQARSGAEGIEHQLRQNLLKEAPGAAAKRRLGGPLSAEEREPLLRGLGEIERLGPFSEQNGTGRFFLSVLPVLPNVFHPTGMPRGTPSLVHSPLTEAYHLVRFASNRLATLRASGVRLLTETARSSFHDAVEALFGPLDQETAQEEPSSLAALLVRIWPLTRGPGLRSVVPGLFRMDGWRTAPEGTDAFVEHPVERLPSVYEVLPLAPPTIDRDEAERGNVPGAPVPLPDEGGGTARLPCVRTSPGAFTTGLLTPDGAVFLPSLPVGGPAPAAMEFWAERAARDRLLRMYLARLMMIIGMRASREADDAVQALMAALHHPGSRPLDFVRLLEGPRSTRLPEDGEQARQQLGVTMERAFPGDSARLQLARARLVEALAGWWKSFPREGAPSGWSWLPLGEKGQRGGNRFAPPLSSPAWREWPSMVAATTPVRFFMAHEGLSVDGNWHPLLLRALGFETEVLATIPEATVLEQLPEVAPPPVPEPASPELVDAGTLVDARPGTGRGIVPGLHEVSILEVPMTVWLGVPPSKPAEPPPPEVSLLAVPMSAWLKQDRDL
ncbi:hypothetical protein D7Y11_05935 [Corallococcus sp. AB018]|nr:hypothetical protein D7Y11_05935 [Corallococcus sp. AB018]